MSKHLRYAALALSLAAFATPVFTIAAMVPKEMKDLNTQACLTLAERFDANAPKDKAKVPVYCDCVSETYWASVPQTEFDQARAEQIAANFDGPAGKSMNKNMQPRLDAAQKACAKK